MVKLPDAQNMIGRIEPQWRAFSPGYHLPDFVSGAGAGLKQFGAGLESLGAHIKAKQDELQAAQAETDFSINNDNLWLQSAQDPDYQNAPDKFWRESQDNINKSAASIADPQRRAMFIEQATRAAHNKMFRLQEFGVHRYQNETTASNDDRLGSLIQQSVQNPDESYRANKLQEGQKIIDSEYWLSPTQRQLRKKRFVHQYGRAIYEQKALTDPDSVINETDKYFKDAPTTPAPEKTPGPQSSIAPLQPTPGHSPDVADVDHRLLQSVTEGASSLPPGYKVTINGGYTPYGHAKGSQHHIKGSGALDVQIWGPDGNPIPNEGTDRTGMYAKLAEGSYRAAQRLGVGDRFAWGGRFATVTGGSTPDLMHFDLGGDRGHFRPSLAEMFGGQRGRINVANDRVNTVNDRVNYAMNFLTSKGLTREQASGFVGNLLQENGDLDPNKSHDSGAGIGLAGWNGDRRVALERMGGAGDFQKQLAFAWQELNTTEAPALEAIRKATSPQEAAVAAQKYFRPGDPRTPNRVNNALAVYKDYKDQPGGQQYAQADTGVMSDAGPQDPMQYTSNGQYAPVDARKGSVAEFMTADDLYHYREMAIREKRARILDSERQQRIQEHQAKLQSDARETEILQDAVSDNPSISIRDIMNDQSLSREAKERLPGVIQKLSDKEDRLSPNVSHRNANHLIEDIRREDGDPQKITTLTPLYDALTNNEINKEDFKFVRDEYDKLTKEGGDRFDKVKGEFYKRIQPQIDKSNPLMGQLDPNGSEAFYRFQFDTNKKIEEYRKQGKNPWDLLDPNKPDYIGAPRALQPYQKTLQQSLESIQQRLSPAPGAGSALQAPQIQQRNPGESIEDYLKRTSGQ